MGHQQYYRLTLSNPHNSYSEQGQASVGDLIVFGVNGNGISKNLIDHRFNQFAPDSSPAESMHATGLHFWAQHDLADDAAAATHGVYRLRMPSVGSFAIPLNVRYGFGGIPLSGHYSERRLDVTWNAQVAVAPNNQALYNFMNQAGIQGSYLEGFVLDQLFGATHHPARSATQILLEAAEQQIPIYTLTPENAADILPQLNISSDVRTDINHAISGGKHVTIPQHELTRDGWQGIGYIIQDPVTGEGVYWIDGGYRGGTWEGCEIVTEAMMLPVERMRFLLAGDMFHDIQDNLHAFKEAILKQDVFDEDAKARIDDNFDKSFDFLAKHQVAMHHFLGAHRNLDPRAIALQIY